MINFNCEKEEVDIIREIVTRYEETIAEAGEKEKIDSQEYIMDLAACHCNGCKLRLDDLLAADSFNLVHDVAGIHGNINRRTGELDDNFLPRFAEGGCS